MCYDYQFFFQDSSSLFTVQDKISPSSAPKAPSERASLRFAVLSAGCCLRRAAPAAAVSRAQQTAASWMARSRLACARAGGTKLPVGSTPCLPWGRRCWGRILCKHPRCAAGRSQGCRFATARRGSRKDLQNKFKTFVLPLFTLRESTLRFVWSQNHRITE